MTNFSSSIIFSPLVCVFDGNFVVSIVLSLSSRISTVNLSAFEFFTYSFSPSCHSSMGLFVFPGSGELIDSRRMRIDVDVM